MTSSLESSRTFQWRPTPTANRWKTAQGGSYLAAGVGSGITGRGAHVLLIDDPHKNREEANSQTVRDMTFVLIPSGAGTTQPSAPIAAQTPNRTSIDRSNWPPCEDGMKVVDAHKSGSTALIASVAATPRTSRQSRQDRVTGSQTASISARHNSIYFVRIWM